MQEKCRATRRRLTSDAGQSAVDRDGRFGVGSMSDVSLPMSDFSFGVTRNGMVIVVGVRVGSVGSMGDFRKLVAWQKAHAYALAVHGAFKGRHANVAPGSRAQILRAVDAIGDNLAEGCAKRSRLELAHFADSAYASSKEVENDLLRARALGILPWRKVDSLLRQGDEVSRLCYGLSKPIRNPTDRKQPQSDRKSDVRNPTSDISQSCESTDSEKSDV